MKEKLLQYGNDSAIAFSTGTVLQETSSAQNSIALLIVTALAPVIRDLGMKLVALIAKKLNKKDVTTK